MPSQEIKSTKQQLRKEIRAMLKSLSAEEKVTESAKIRERIKIWLKEHPEVRTVASFANMPIEPELLQLLEEMPHIRWVFPHSQADGIMHFHQISTTCELESGLYGILQPKESSNTLVEPSDIDCFLCPAFAYTKEGKRLGKGGGYYDRLLAQRRNDSVLLGIVFKQQVLKKLPIEEHDIAVNCVLSN